jgi:hypothetical protein
MLDDECKINGTDAKLAGRLQKDLSPHPRFYASKKMQVRHRGGGGGCVVGCMEELVLCG